MIFNNIEYVAAIAIAIGFSGVAYAQTTVGGISVGEEYLPRVTAYCQKLHGATLAEPAGDDAEASESESAPNGTDGALTTIDMSTIDLQDRKDAGLVTE
ncbi:MAG: hypothetical protein MO852_06465 [Candidatus Devosia euplotis]|nr:hypothetical protein [Candidatus Devosia euplotis]